MGHNSSTCNTHQPKNLNYIHNMGSGCSSPSSDGVMEWIEEHMPENKEESSDSSSDDERRRRKRRRSRRRSRRLLRRPTNPVVINVNSHMPPSPARSEEEDHKESYEPLRPLPSRMPDNSGHVLMHLIDSGYTIRRD